MIAEAMIDIARLLGAVLLAVAGVLALVLRERRPRRRPATERVSVAAEDLRQRQDDAEARRQSARS